ncbi:MAG: aldehyde ferredoxin oxidoreductase family protein [Anaerolineaceae bacterium]|nr:aldehyde ferredoxin oxidoreductase family protein [Anaerolineaceae bacterium]
MIYGTTAKIIRVDLNTGSWEVEELTEEFYRLYPGGKALAGYILLNELPANTDPLSPENVLVIANGLMTGAPISTTTRYLVSARSPLTNGYGESEAGGFWGPELKMAGFEAIIVKGKSPKPVYLWIQDGEIEIRTAEHIWGMKTGEAQETIREELDDKKIRVLQIGPAGENLVRFAGITNDLRHFNGRNGMGAVMGSKNLRAIAVRGRTRYQSFARDPKALVALGSKLARRVKENPQSWSLQNTGTPGLVEPLNTGGLLPTRNFRQGVFEKAGDIKWEVYESELLTARRSCYACAIRCKREVRVDGKHSVYGGPEYESIGSLGPNCGVGDIHAIARANELCNAYMLDSISTGMAISFAMECFEHGLLTLEDTDGLELRFGNAEAMVTMVEWIALRQGLGDLLAEGVMRAAEKIGRDSQHFAMHVKGQELAMHEARGKYNVGMGYAISEIGADHLVVAHDPMLANPEGLPFKNARPLGIIEAQPSLSLNDEKMRQFFILEAWGSLEKVIGYCFFGPAPRSFILIDEVLESVNAATNWNLTLENLLEIGERATNMARVFNIREGFTRKDDTLPQRIFAPLENGPMKGQAFPKKEFQAALTVLYSIKGWDSETGIPSRERLEALSLSWAADLLE